MAYTNLSPKYCILFLLCNFNTFLSVIYFSTTPNVINEKIDKNDVKICDGSKMSKYVDKKCINNSKKVLTIFTFK